MKTARFFLVLVLLISCLPVNVFSQTATTSRITGLVTDPNGAVIAGASVKLTSKETRAEKSSALRRTRLASVGEKAIR